MVTGKSGQRKSAAVALVVMASLALPGGVLAQSGRDFTNYTAELARHYPTAYRRYLSELPAGLAALPWLHQLERDANGEVRRFTVAGRPMLYAFACVPHDCANNSLDLLFAPDQSRVVGLVHLETKAGGESVVTIGEPTPAETACLENPAIGALEGSPTCPPS